MAAMAAAFAASLVVVTSLQIDEFRINALGYLLDLFPADS
jgi:hypothetical protein